MAEAILLHLEYDEGGAREKVKALNAELKNAVAEFNGLNKMLQSGNLTTAEHAKRQEELQHSIERLKKEVSENVKVVKQQDQAYKAAGAGLSKMSAGTADLAKKATALTSQQNISTAAVKKHEAALEGAEKVTGLFGGSLQTVKDVLEKTKTGLEGAKLGLTGLKGAIAATGIGVLLLALGALVTFLTKSQAGMDLLARKTAGIQAVFGFLTKSVSAVGEALVNAWDKPGEAVKRFGDFIEQNLTNRIKAFGVILKAIKEGSFVGLVDGVVQVATGVTDASKKAKQLAEDLNEVRKKGEAVAAESIRIRDAEQKLNVERQNSRAQVEKLKMIGDDTTKSTKERLAAIKQAGSIELGLLAKQEKLQLAKIANIKAENKLNGNLFEDRQKLADAEIELGAIREESAGKLTEIQNTKNGLEQEGKDKAIEAAKEVLSAQIAAYELLLRAAKRNGDETLKIQEDIINKQAELEKKGVKDRRTRELIDLKAQQDIVDLRVEQVATEQERFFKIRQSGINARLSAVKKGTKEEADLIKEQISVQAQLDRISVVNTVKNQKERLAKLAEINAAEKAQRLAVDASLRAQLAQNDATAIQARLNAVRAGSEEEFQLRKDLLDAQMRAELENVNLTEQQIAEIRSRYAAARNQVETERIVKRRNEEVLSAQIELDKTKEGSEAQYKARKKVIEKERAERIAAAKEDAKAIEKINSESDRALSDLDTERFNKLTDEIAEAASRTTSTISALFEIQDNRAKQSLEERAKLALESAGENAELRGAIEEDLQKQREEIEAKGAKKRKAIARAEAAINTAVAITKALTSGAILGPLLAVTIGLQGLAQQAIISAQEFADGGVYRTNTHEPIVRGAGGPKSDNVNAKLSPGESVLTAKATKMFYPQLSRMNQAGGGRAFPGVESASMTVPMPHYAMHYASGGVAPTIVNTPAEIDYSQLASAIGQEFRANPIYTRVTDVQNGINAVQLRADRHDARIG